MIITGVGCYFMPQKNQRSGLDLRKDGLDRGYGSQHGVLGGLSRLLRRCDRLLLPAPSCAVSAVTAAVSTAVVLEHRRKLREHRL